MSKISINKKQNQYIKNINRQKIFYITRTNVFFEKKRVFLIKKHIKKIQFYNSQAIKNNKQHNIIIYNVNSNKRL